MHTWDTVGRNALEEISPWGKTSAHIGQAQQVKVFTGFVYF